MPDDLAQLPTDPGQQRIAALQSLFPQNSQAAAGTTPPVAGASPAQPPDITGEMVQASRQGRQVFGEELGKSRDYGSQIQQLIQQQQATPVPKTGFLDTQGQPQKGGFLHNLGRALIAAGTATTPGAAIQEAYYAPGIRRYEAETGARAKEIEQLRGQQEESEKRGTAGAGMVSKPITAAAQAEKAAATTTRANAYVTASAAQAKATLAGIDLKRAALDEKTRADLARELQAKADEAGRNFREQHRDATAEEIANVVSGTKENIANEVSARNPSLKEWAMQWLGMGTAQIPSATTPQQRPTPTAPTKPAAKAAAGAVPKGSIVYDPQGKAHTSDGTHALPKGWSAKKPGA